MFKPNYIRSGLKTKTEAVTKILSDIVSNPGCADLDGGCQVFAFATWMNLTPTKKKQ